jgi:hypothetical protein
VRIESRRDADLSKLALKSLDPVAALYQPLPSPLSSREFVNFSIFRLSAYATTLYPTATLSLLSS